MRQAAPRLTSFGQVNVAGRAYTRHCDDFTASRLPDKIDISRNQMLRFGPDVLRNRNAHAKCHSLLLRQHGRRAVQAADCPEDAEDEHDDGRSLRPRG